MQATLILAALLVWNPAAGARGATPDAVLAEYAAAIADVCNLEEDGRTLSAEQCLTLAAIPSEETHFAPWVLDGSCNRMGWRAMHQMHKVCDGGKAYGVFQVWAKPWADVAPAGGKDDPAIRDPFVHALVARRLLLKNPRGWMTYDTARSKADAWL